MKSKQAFTPAALKYLELLKKTLTHSLWPIDCIPVQESEFKLFHFSHINRWLMKKIQSSNFLICKNERFDPEIRNGGRDWPNLAHTMIGKYRLDNLQYCIDTILTDDVPGDFIETGVWRGGASIFMKAALDICDESTRKIWVADSFAGLPPPNPNDYPADLGDQHHKIAFLAVSLEEVKENFRKYDVLDDRVIFLKGWFKDTLPKANFSSFSLIRLDGDMYESTMDALNSLWDKLSPGGFIIIDDYCLEPCRKAVHDFRSARSIHSSIHDIDGIGAFWRKE